MKKSALTLLAVLMTVFAMSALNPQEIVGTWECKPTSLDSPAPEMTMKIKNKYTFRDDCTASIHSECEMSMDLGDRKYADVYFVVTSDASYTVEGDSVKITPDASTVRVKMTEDDVRVRGIDDPNMCTMLQTQMYNMMQPLAQSMREQVGEIVLNDVHIDGKTMTCTEDDTKITYTRRKK